MGTNINVIGGTYTKGNNNNINVTYNGDSWSELEITFEGLIDELRKDSDELHFSKNIYEYIKDKDEKGLRGFMKGYAPKFASDTLTGVASSMVVEFLKNFKG